MVTYSELFQFCILIVGIIGLVIQATKKEVIATPFQLLAITSKTM